VPTLEVLQQGGSPSAPAHGPGGEPAGYASPARRRTSATSASESQ
jgi:hypothetical protein